ncbi:hypothetical protein D049_0061A, partial [Vibrio parahaemolyticus VPTS-2010]|jgi:hypothetical protein
MVTA